MKVCLVGSSGGHLTHLYMLKPFWKDKERFWVTFDKEDARSLLEGEKVYPCYYPTNRSLKALVKNTKIAWDVLHGRASVMVQTSRWEGFGMTILEAMSCGIPVVAFHNYGPDEIIRDSVDGYLVDHFDTEAFAKKVVEILKQPEQRKQMGKCAIERSQDFSLEKVLPLFKQYLEEAAKGL